jgi:hypothetical protein
MGLMLPGELSSLLNMLGYNWPESDESKLFGLGSSWHGFNGKFNSPIGAADGHAQTAASEGRGKGVDAFQAAWHEPKSPKENLVNGSVAASLIGGGLFVCAGVVIALKINVIIQLITLAIQIAQAIATAVVTFGASLAEIPIFKFITGLLVGELEDMAIGAVLGG